jgi:FtsZ-binding cell division protein ZapB
MSFTIICENNEKERCVMGIIETLQAEIQALKERVTALEQLTKGSDTLAPATRQLTRDDIIEKAKRDVWKLGWEQEAVFGRYVDFKINREKRAVVALLRGKWSHRIFKRGIAKCHPDDCFNAAIGRAIALRRALKLEVPNEYLNAPQPTEVKVGDIVESYSFKQPKRYVVVGTDKEVDEKEGCCHVNSIIATSFPYRTRIIDDSREEV